MGRSGAIAQAEARFGNAAQQRHLISAMGIRSWIGVSLAFGAMLTGTPANAHAWIVEGQPSALFVQACNAELGPTKIIVQTPPSPMRYRYDLSIKDLSNRAESSLHVLGLTEATYEYKASANGKALIDSKSGMACLRPTVTYRISTGTQTISIAREFAQGSCAHAVIMEHELRHARVNQSVAERVGQATQAGLTAYFGQRIFYGSIKGIEREIITRINEDWMPWVSKQMGLAEELHSNIDSPDEDARMGVVCDGEITHTIWAAKRRAAKR